MFKKLLKLFLASNLIATAVWAQDWDDALGIGLRGGVTQYQGNDFSSKKIRPWGAAFGESYLTNQFSLEMAFNLGRIAGETGNTNFRSTLTGLSLLGRLGLLPTESFRPYLAGGLEYLGVDPQDQNQLSAHNRAFVGFPFGGGVSLGISENTALDFRGLYHYTLRDRLDGAEAGRDDAFLSGTVGLTKLFRANKDRDGDGLLDKDEKARGTNRKLADTDGDGLNDGEEVLTYNTDPLKADTDGDGLSDSDEVKKHKTSPLKADSDGDGLNDGEELNRLRTDPVKADTDGDGLDDGAEVKTTNTEALKADTDGDNLNDGEEVNRYKTNPLKTDTDNGSVNDGVEVARNSNPNDVSDDVPPKQEMIKPRETQALKIEVGKNIVLDGVVFKTSSAVISAPSQEILTRAFNALNDNPEIEVEIQGHTDNQGSAAANMKLSQSRAEAVKAWLVKKGIAAQRMTTKGFGPDKPIASNATPEGRQQNRRIEFARLK